MDTGKKKKTLPEDGFQGKNAKSTGPVNDPGSKPTNPSQEEISGSQFKSLSHKLKEHPEDGDGVSDAQ